MVRAALQRKTAREMKSAGVRRAQPHLGERRRGFVTQDGYSRGDGELRFAQQPVAISVGQENMPVAIKKHGRAPDTSGSSSMDLARRASLIQLALFRRDVAERQTSSMSFGKRQAR